MTRLAWIALLASCLDKSQTQCDDDGVCPADTVCLVGGGCATPEQLAACTGSDGLPLMSGAACTFGREVGHCVGQVCVGSLCGNGVVDPPDEVCDPKDPRPDAPPCRADCLKGGNHCGDGTVDTYAGEECDSTPGCSPTCHIEVCGNGIPDPGEACDDGNHLDGDGCSADCKSNEKCGNRIVDVAAGEQCDHGGTNGTPGDGCSLLCKIQVCGNHVVDPGEVCDDGNTVSGDGCSADCLSEETCGNGQLDLAMGEQCDDSNHLSHDGCDSGCRLEIGTWTQLTFASPQSSTLLAMAYDAAHAMTVEVGGVGASSTDTYLWDGNAWIELSVFPAPPARDAHAMAYDASRKRVVLFGGELAGTLRGDTWEWDGATWAQRTLAHVPGDGSANAGLQQFAMTYDAAHRQVVLFGGIGFDGQARGDTWVFDGNDWTQLAPATSPPPQFGHTMAYDAARGVVVMFGLGETWEWDGTDWTQRFPATSPPAGSRTMAYDAGRARSVLFVDDGQPQTWEWDGTEWTQLPDPSPVSGVGGFTYDVARGQLVLFGGSTWTRSGTTWSERTLAAPSGRIGHAMAYDSRRSTIVQFGGYSGTIDDLAHGRGVLGDTWLWTGTSWVQSTVAAPPPRYEHAMSYDPVRDRIVLFGGDGAFNTPPLADTWEWDGATWTQPPASASPPARRMHAMAYETNDSHTLIFAGESTGIGNSGLWSGLTDTWAWDGTTWIEQPPVFEPQYGATMSFRSFEQGGLFGSTILFGGNGDFQGETFAWFPGFGWFFASTPTSLPPRVWAASAYDPVRHRTVVFGGYDFLHNTGLFTPLDDTWEFDGSTWTQVNIGGPPPRSQHAMAYDATHQQIIMSGGTQFIELTNGGIVQLPDTWSFQVRSQLPDEACTTGIDGDGDGLIGCDDPDCWGYCAPLCPPGSTGCPAGPSCGDGVCSPLENCRLCPTDCGTCAPVCGDFLCDPDETAASCPGDCP